MDTFKANGRSVPQSEPEGLTIQVIKSKLIKNWYWFVSLCFVGAVLAFVYNKMALPYYRISTTILVKDDSKNTDLNNVFRQLNPSKINPGIQDQVGVLKSYNLNLKTMQYFDWRYSLYKKRLLSSRDLYKSEPFAVEIPSDFAQAENVPVAITPVSKDSYIVECKQKVMIGGVDREIDFKKQVKYGEVFKNKYFQFSLTRKEEILIKDGDEFILVFNNIGKLAMAYKAKLEVKAAGEDSNLITVDLVTNQLTRDVDYLNQLGKIYIQYGLEEKNRVANNTIKFIDDQIAGVNSSLQSAGDKFTSFRSQNKTVDLGQEASAIVDKLKQVESDRANVDLKLEYYNNLKFYLDNRDQNNDLVAPSLPGVTDEALNATVRKLNELYTRREVLSYTVQEKNPVLVSLDNEISFTKNSLRESIENLIGSAKVELQTLNERQYKVNSELSKLPKTEQDLIGIKRNFDLNNELYTFLLQRRAEAEIAKASNNPDAQILDPTDNTIALLMGPILIINLFIGLMAGFFIALCIVVVKELISETLTSVDDISRRLDVSIVGSIAINKYETERPVYEYPRSALTESFRGLRVNLEFLFREAEGKVLAVHSHISGEGKSFVAFNLALIFAMSNKKVLLVDGDLRRPRLHTLLNQENEAGLGSFLEGEAAFTEILRKTDIPNLSFVSAGPNHHNSAELLNTNRIKAFVQTVKEQFDFIIFDNSPIGVVYDAALIGAHADFNLVLLRLHFSKRNEISEVNKIGHDGILKRVMVAVNGVKQGKSYGYYTEGSKRTKKEVA